MQNTQMKICGLLYENKVLILIIIEQYYFVINHFNTYKYRHRFLKTKRVKLKNNLYYDLLIQNHIFYTNKFYLECSSWSTLAGDWDRNSSGLVNNKVLSSLCKNNTLFLESLLHSIKLSTSSS